MPDAANTFSCVHDTQDDVDNWINVMVMRFSPLTKRCDKVRSSLQRNKKKIIKSYYCQFVFTKHLTASISFILPIDLKHNIW